MLFQIIAGLLLIAVILRDPARCELVEINHCHTSEGQPQFVQLIGWDWSPDRRVWDAQQWILVQDWDRQSHTVTAQQVNGLPVTVRCRLFRETWTMFDPEVFNRQFFKTRFRREIW